MPQNYAKYNSHLLLHIKHSSYFFLTLLNEIYIQGVPGGMCETSGECSCIFLPKSCLPVYSNYCLLEVNINNALADVQILTSFLVDKNYLLVHEQGG